MPPPAWREFSPFLGGLVFDRDIEFYYLVLAVVLLVSLAVNNLIQSRTGRALRAIRESEHAAQTAGMDTSLLKLQAFVFSAVLAGLAGGCMPSTSPSLAPPLQLPHVRPVCPDGCCGRPGQFWGPLQGSGLVVALGEAPALGGAPGNPGRRGEYQIIFSASSWCW